MKNCFKSFVLFISMICFQTYAQKYEFELPCDTLTSQTEMNICTGYKSRMIDSLVNLKYNCFRTILEKDYNQSLKEKNTEMIDYYKSLIDALDSSQKNYLDLAKANRLFYNNVYEGGSMRGMMVNLSSISDGIERLKKLDDFIIQFSGEDTGFCQ